MGENRNWMFMSVVILIAVTIAPAYLGIFSGDLIFRGWGLGVLTMLVGGLTAQLYREISQSHHRKSLLTAAREQLRKELTRNIDVVLNEEKHLLSTMAWTVACLSGLVLSLDKDQLSRITEAYVRIEFYNHDLEKFGPRTQKRRSNVADYINKALKDIGGVDLDSLSTTVISTDYD